MPPPIVLNNSLTTSLSSTIKQVDDERVCLAQSMLNKVKNAKRDLEILDVDEDDITLPVGLNTTFEIKLSKVKTAEERKRSAPTRADKTTAPSSSTTTYQMIKTPPTAMKLKLRVHGKFTLVWSIARDTPFSKVPFCQVIQKYMKFFNWFDFKYNV